MGKERSKRNSLKHGIFAKATVLDGESRAEFDFLLKGLRDCLDPVGALEDLFVEKLANIVWRERRSLVAEGAAIRLGAQLGEDDEKQRQSNEADEILTMSSPGGLMAKIKNPKILQTCLDLLTDLKDAIEQRGFNPEKDTAVLSTLYGDQEDH